MELINNYWTDENNNRWNSEIYTKERAEKYSNSLINCNNCRDCRDCRDCSYCRNCRNCRDSSYCSYCRNCRNCSDCSYCRDCSDCSYCQNFKENPEKITSPKIGSRSEQTTFYFTKDHEQIVCGCFTGTMQEFEKEVFEKHENTKYFSEYFNWISAVKVYRSLLKTYDND